MKKASMHGMGPYGNWGLGSLPEKPMVGMGVGGQLGAMSDIRPDKEHVLMEGGQPSGLCRSSGVGAGSRGGGPRGSTGRWEWTVSVLREGAST